MELVNNLSIMILGIIFLIPIPIPYISIYKLIKLFIKLINHKTSLKGFLSYSLIAVIYIVTASITVIIIYIQMTLFTYEGNAGTAGGIYIFFANWILTPILLFFWWILKKTTLIDD